MRSNAIVIVRTMGLSQQSLSCNRLAAVLILIASLLTISFFPLSGAQLANSNTTSNNGQIELFQPDSKPYGLSYADWTARWWQWAFAEFLNLKTEEQLRQCAKQMQDSVIHLEASVNGIPLTGLEKYRIQSRLFNFTLPENSTLGLSPQTTQAVSDGNWVFLKPLSVGNNTI